MRECINDALSLSEDNAVDDDNPVGEDHQHLEETFDDFDQHPLDTHNFTLHMPLSYRSHGW